MKPLTERIIETDSIPAPDQKLGEPTEMHAADKKMKKLENPIEEDTSSVEIISYGQCFSPYKSQLHRQFSEEDLVIDVDELEDVSNMEGGGYEADSERSTESINYGSLNDLTESPEQLHDTADSLESFMQLSNIPRVTIHSRTRVKRCLSYV
ncbi:hypothetical protein E3N88_30422 [Mikania micrantha]|uniref:Uncharacterized protein n=1 Tax=Mikania micrantha TaxID=192012 RepID=A0A5N6MM50_9ASTR|nr:hypothetical protein E3N88_30422 [Mikania micrantha]